ncbi:MAG: Slp family lipoprotein, partial [Nitrospira sp.]|nr:Slp family lipoprotein [Nitrospira sp.]
MSHAATIVLLLSGTLVLSSCAESFHQLQREADRLGIPPELAQEIDESVAFTDLQASADQYVGRIVSIGGIVLTAKRTKERTEIEILQLPSKQGEPSTKDRIRSEGRFLAVRQEFLDPASVPAGTPITIIGAVMGSTQRLLDESEYTYPLLEIKHLIDWTT